MGCMAEVRKLWRNTKEQIGGAGALLAVTAAIAVLFYVVIL